MNRTILESAKCVQVFKSDRLGIRYYDEDPATLHALAYEVVSVDENGSVYFYGVCSYGIGSFGQVSQDECCVINDVDIEDVDELLDCCLTDDEKDDVVSKLAFFNVLYAYSKKCPGTVFTNLAIDYIERMIANYREEVDEMMEESEKKE